MLLAAALLAAGLIVYTRSRASLVATASRVPFEDVAGGADTGAPVMASTKANVDPRQALAYALRAGDSEVERYQSATAILHAWSDVDLAAAWLWARDAGAAIAVAGFPTPEEAVLARAAQRGADHVVALVEQVSRAPSTDARGTIALAERAISALLESRHTSAAQAVLACCLAHVGEASLPTAAVERVAFALASESPAAVLTWLNTLPDSAARQHALATAVGVFASEEPEHAMRFALGLPVARGRADIMARAFEEWLVRDSDASLTWLAAHEALPEADRLLASWVTGSSLAQQQPRLGVTWAELIRDRNAHASAYGEALVRWAGRDFAAAQHALESNRRLLPEEVERLRREIASVGAN